MKTLPKTILDVDILNKTVLLRLNLDVPLRDGEIVDDFKIKNAIETIQYLLKQKCKVIILSHLGEPAGKEVDSLSLMNVRFALGRILEKQIKFANIVACENSIKFMDFAEILMIENLKFYPGELSKKEADQNALLEKLIPLVDYYVFDSYGSNLNLASISVPTKRLKTLIGLQLDSEIKLANKIKEFGNSNITAVLGDNDLHITYSILDFITAGNNKIILGGSLGIHFLNAMGIKTGSNVIDEKLLAKVSKYIKLAKKNNCEIILPVDHIAVEKKDLSQKPVEVLTQQINKDLISKDIGPKTIVAYRELIESSKMILWSGSMGEFTNEKFNKGTESVGEFIALSTPKECYKLTIGPLTYFAMNLLKIKPKRFNFSSVDSQILSDFMLNKESDILNLLTKK